MNRRGFTILEIMIAVIILTVGVLGLVSTAAYVTRMIARGQRSALAGTFAQRRLEYFRGKISRLRTCDTAWVNSSGFLNTRKADTTLYRGSAILATDTVKLVKAGVGSGTAVQIFLKVNYVTAPGKTRNDSLETEVSCRS